MQDPGEAPITIRLAQKDAQTELFLDGRIELHTRRGVRGSDRLLLEALSEPLTGPILTVGSSHCAVALATRALHPELSVHALFEDAHRFRTAKRQTGEHPELPLTLHLRPRPGDAVPAGTEGFSVIFLATSHAGDAQLTSDVLQECHRALRPRGKLIAAINNSRDRWLHERIVRLFGAASLQRSRRGSLYIARKTKAKARYREFRRNFPARLFGQDVSLATVPGVFSHGELDEGTLALAETIAVDPGDNVLDLGCGCGAIGVAAALAVGSGQVLLVDSSTRAAEVAQQNLRQNGTTNAAVLLAHDLSAVRPAAFDVVLTNPPYYSDYRISAQFIQESRTVLRPGGLLGLVTKSPEPHAELLLKTFGTVDQVERRGYSVFLAR